MSIYRVKGYHLTKLQNSVWSKLKAFADDNFQFEIGHGKCRNFAGKGENAGYQHFLHFPQCFQKTFFTASCNPFPNKPWFLRVCTRSLLKTLWEREKLLVMRNFSFSGSVYYPLRQLLPFLSNLKLSSANSFSLEESVISRLGKGYSVL